MNSSMEIFMWLGGIELKAVLILGLGWLVCRIFPQASAASKHQVMAVTFLSVLLIPVAGWLFPFEKIHLGLGRWFSVGGGVGNLEKAGSQEGVGGWLLGVWLLGCFVMLFRWAWGCWRIHCLEKRSHRVLDKDWLLALERVAKKTGLRKTPSLRVVDGIHGPMVWGWWKPSVVIPMEGLRWSGARRETVLMHEAAHIRRKDLLVQGMVHGVCVVHWFNPVAWMAERQMRLWREQACDDCVLNSGATPEGYAMQLLSMVREVGGMGLKPLLTEGMARPGELEMRIRSLLNDGIQRSHMGLRGQIRLGMVGAAVMVLLGWVEMVPEKQTVHAAQNSANSILDAATHDAQAFMQPGRRRIVSFRQVSMQSPDLPDGLSLPDGMEPVNGKAEASPAPTRRRMITGG